MTIREALGGPWVRRWVLLLALLPPTVLLVLLRESVTPFPQWWWPLVSASVQHLATAAVVLGGFAIARRVHGIVPTVTSLSIWSLGAAIRGIVAGSIAQQVAGVAPEFASRIGIWTLVGLVWIPALVYVIAQYERRRVIIGSLDVTRFELGRELPVASTSSADVQQRLRRAIAESLAPALDDLRASLEASRALLDRASVAELSLRISQLHDDAADLLASARSPQGVTPSPRAALRRVFDLPPRRPWLTAMLVGVATCALIVFDAWRIFGELAAIEVVVSTVAASLVIGLVPAIVAFARPGALEAHGQRTTTVAGLLGIFVAVYLMLNSGIDPITWHGLYLVPLLAIGLTGASATYLSAIVLADANDEAVAKLASLNRELTAAKERNESLVEGERQRLADLMHGPVQGRIAACIMALNFATSTGVGDHRDGARETGGTEQHDARHLTDSVLNHLRAASRDLAQITAGIGRSSP